jgi:hypothetical protein
MSTKNLVTRGEADSVAGHTNGYSATTANTNVVAVNLSLWSGRYVKMIAQGQNFYYAWGPASEIPNAATYLKTGAQTTPGTAGVADVLPAGAWAFEVPTDEDFVLFFRSAAAGGQLTVLPK